MSISTKSIKILWSSAAGRCAYPDCWEKLTFPDAGKQTPFTLGEMAHICGKNPGSNRYNPDQTDKARDDYTNLILLCPTHHSLIDKKENEAIYTVEWLLKVKSAHEYRVQRSLEVDATKTLDDVAKRILAILADNEQSWSQYGPLSELARTQPQSEEAYAIWFAERLSTIVPNNRRLAMLAETHRDKFDVQQQEIIAEFLLHAKSYEQWVADAIPYSAVKRFPTEFHSMIREIVDAGS